MEYLLSMWKTEEKLVERGYKLLVNYKGDFDDVYLYKDGIIIRELKRTEIQCTYFLVLSKNDIEFIENILNQDV